MRTAFSVELQRAQGDRALGALERVFERDLDGRVMIFTARAEVLPRGSAALGRAEQRGKELAEFRMLRRPAAGATMELEARVPVGRRTELALRLPASRDLLGQRVVCRALLLVAQHLIRLVDLLHAPGGVGLLADVGVVLAGEPPVGLAHLVFRRGALDAEHAVVILELHALPSSVSLEPALEQPRQQLGRVARRGAAWPGIRRRVQRQSMNRVMSWLSDNKADG